MSFTVSEPQVKLSFCITTLNRAELIGATLESIITQATDECEIVVLDAASTDHTPQVLAEYAERFEHLRYFRQEANHGIDEDFDRTVALARGQYCWLLPDDDLLKPDAVSTVLKAIDKAYSLIVVNAEAKDVEMSRVIVPRAVSIASDLIFGPTEANELFEAAWKVIAYLGCTIIQRKIWLSRQRARYYGSWLIHVGVIFQAPLPGDTLVLAEPLMSLRVGNQSWLDRQFEIMVVCIPSVFRSLPLRESAKLKATYVEPWRHPLTMLYYRAVGSFSRSEYDKFVRPYVHSTRDALTLRLVTLVPGVVANTYLLFHYSIFRRRDKGASLVFLRQSRHYIWKKKWVARKQQAARPDGVMP